jgi:hypothetical protein
MDGGASRSYPGAVQPEVRRDAHNIKAVAAELNGTERRSCGAPRQARYDAIPRQPEGERTHDRMNQTPISAQQHQAAMPSMMFSNVFRCNQNVLISGLTFSLEFDDGLGNF